MDFIRPTAAAGSMASELVGARVLIVGPLGRGVGLARDAIELVTAQCDCAAYLTDSVARTTRATRCAAIVDLGGRHDATQPLCRTVDCLLAFGSLDAGHASSLLSPRGRGLAIFNPEPRHRFGRQEIILRPELGRFDFDSRLQLWSVPGGCAPIVQVWQGLGWLSTQLALPTEAWQRALEESVPARLRAAVERAFGDGRLRAPQVLR